MNLINSEINRTCPNEHIAQQIRNIVLRHATKFLPNHAFHLESDLNWLRYLKQVEFLKRIISPRSKVLDLGCGLGQTTALLASSCEHINIVGADIQKHSCWHELRKFGCEFCKCDAISLPFRPRIFDAIISFGVMEHTNSDIKFLREINECLKNDGYNILFQLPNKYSFSECLSKELGLWHHERTYSRNDIAELFKISGFNIQYISKEHVIPAQVNRVNRTLADIFDKNHIVIYKLDEIFCKTPLSIFSQDYVIISRKL
jgi:ubiquinone/menaquinone biosynthesis C-methylase UbiE